MAVDILREDYDDDHVISESGSPLVLPTFSDRYDVYGLTTTVGNPEQFRPTANDFLVDTVQTVWWSSPTVAQVIPHLGTLGYTYGNEWRIRQLWAQLGFKPSIEFARKGWPFDEVTLSRVNDLEDVDSERNGYVHSNSAIQSHVAPYTLYSGTAPTSPTINSGNAVVVDPVSDLGLFGGGVLAPWPYPRVLNAWRIWDVDKSEPWAPRGSYIAGITPSGPDWVPIYPDGTLKVSSGFDSARFITGGTAGQFIMRPGMNYEIQIGHVEPLPGIYPYGAAQRWYSDADGSLPWIVGDPLP